MDILNWLQQSDQYLFRLINSGMASPRLDGLMMFLRNQYSWVPLYLILLFWFYRYSREYFPLLLIFSLLTFAITDYSSASILKPLFARERPCHNPLLFTRMVADCGGPYGMPSSHASNHFGLAMFWFLYASHIFKQKWFWLWAWAGLICFAQIYVGVHYPGDILAGGILGMTAGLLTFRLFIYFSERWAKRKQTFSLPA